MSKVTVWEERVKNLFHTCVAHTCTMNFTLMAFLIIITYN